MESYDRGSTVLIQVEMKRQAPFGALDYIDPTSIKATITDPENTARVTDATMTKSDVGKYYYICQTQASWPAGSYQVSITGSDGTYTDITIKRMAFRLI